MSKIIKASSYVFPQFVEALITERDKGNYHEFTGNNLSFHYYRDRSYRAYPTNDLQLTSTKPAIKVFRHIADYFKDGMKSTELAAPVVGTVYLVNLREFLDFLQNTKLTTSDFEIVRVYSIHEACIKFNKAP